MTLDRATKQFIQSIADPDAKKLQEMTPEEARAFSRSLAETAGPAPPMVRVEEHRLEREGGNVGLRVLVPIDPPEGVIVYYHGGGWVIGSIDEYDTLARKLAERTSCAGSCQQQLRKHPLRTSELTRMKGRTKMSNNI